MKEKESIREIGQSIILVLLMFLGLVAMLALVLDGGNMYTQRRAAQLAADAGALAGARHLCGDSPDHSSAATDAVLYAVTENNATNATVSFPQVDIIEVTANIEFLPFFAQVLGFNALSASATAAAGCSTPSLGNVLPIAWSCPPPLDDEGNPIEDQICGYEYNQCAEADIEAGTCEPPIYVFMDSDEETCIYPPNSQPGDPGVTGEVDCDWDDDGYDDAWAGVSSRGWLNLVEGANGNADVIRDQIIDACENGIGENLRDHTWVSGADGQGPNFATIHDSCVGEDVIIPVFDYSCPKTLQPETDCQIPDDFHTSNPDYDLYIHSTGTVAYYHIVGFASFVITCVHDSNADMEGVGANAESKCDGRNKLQEANPTLFTWTPSNPKTIEGYLQSDISPDVSGIGGVDSGTYVIYLVR